jgi:hypothetical protein
MDALDDEDSRYLGEAPDGWKFCVLTAHSAPLGGAPNCEGRLAVALETDMSLGVLATAPEFGCVQWQERTVG